MEHLSLHPYPIVPMASHKMASPLLIDTVSGPIVGFSDSYPLFEHPSFAETADGNEGGELPILKWLGIPYAQAGRWERPCRPASWSTPRKCTDFGPRFPQPLNLVDQIFNGKKGYVERQLWESEELGFNLNVFAPSNRRVADSLPVMLWIHGGALEGGSSGCAVYDPTEWIRREAHEGRNFIVVTGNYRTGIFGFLSSQDLVEEDPDGLTGNFGAYDCISMLQWVQENIKKFGGDPNNVTIFGESAGAFLVGALLVTRQKLFKHAIMQSGTPESLTHRDVSSDLNKNFYQALLDHFNISPGRTAHERVQLLKGLPTSKIMEFINQRGSVINDYGLAIENTSSKLSVWPKPVVELIREGRWNPYLESLMIGHTKDEGSLFAYLFQSTTQSRYEEILEQRCPYTPRNTIEKLYPPVGGSLESTSSHIDWKNCLGSRLMADQFFDTPLESFVLALKGTKHHDTGKESKVFVYRIDETVPSVDQGLDWGSFHTVDLPLLFNIKTLWNPDSAQAKSSAEIGRLWVNFARTGCPDPAWPEYQPSSAPLKLIIGSGGALRLKDVREFRSELEKRRIHFWLGELPKIVTWKEHPDSYLSLS